MQGKHESPVLALQVQSRDGSAVARHNANLRDKFLGSRFRAARQLAGETRRAGVHRLDSASWSYGRVRSERPTKRNGHALDVQVPLTCQIVCLHC